MIHKIKKRLRSSGGFTLAEILIVILILLLVTAVVVAGIPAAQRAYTKITDSANAQVLLSTTMTRLRDELGTATDVKVDVSANTVTYLCADGSRSEISFDGSADPKGIYVSRASGGEAFEYLLVSELTGGKGLYMTYELAAPDAGAGLVTFKNLKVLNSSGTLAELPQLEIRVLSGQVSVP